MSIKAGRSPADWDQDVWDGLAAIYDYAWRLDEDELRQFGGSLMFVGTLVGAAVVGGPAVALQRRQIIEGIADGTGYEILRDVLTRAVEQTGGDQDGLTDLATALRDGARGLALKAAGRYREGFTAQNAFLVAKAQMLGLTNMGPQDAFAE